jgi:hypothetical protein
MALSTAKMMFLGSSKNHDKLGIFKDNDLDRLFQNPAVEVASGMASSILENAQKVAETVSIEEMTEKSGCSHRMRMKIAAAIE